VNGFAFCLANFKVPLTTLSLSEIEQPSQNPPSRHFDLLYIASG
jgi:hypothetical protein